MKITTANYPDFVRNATIMWRDGYNRVPLVAKQLYDVSQNQLLNTEISSQDGFTFARKLGESDDYFEENPAQNYSKTMRKYRVGLKATISFNMRLYDKYREIKKQLNGLGTSTSQRMELDLTHRFTFGTATSYVDMDGETVATTVGDGLALFSTAHTTNESSTTFRNIVANNPVFSKGGLEAAETLFATQMVDSNGTKIIVNPDTIVTHNDPVTINAVRTLMLSTGGPDGAHSGVENTYKAKYNLLVLHYLATDNLGARDSDKEKYWMLASVAHTDAVLEVSENPHMIAPSPGGNGEDFDNDDWKFKSSASYGIEISDPKWVVLSQGNGAA